VTETETVSRAPGYLKSALGFCRRRFQAVAAVL